MYAIGIDFGTSGARLCAIDHQATLHWQTRVAYPDATSPQNWRTALFELLGQLPPTIAADASSITLNGTSATVLLCNQQLEPVSPALLYNDTRATPYGEFSATSGLAKFLWLTQHYHGASYFMHQCDWLTALLSGQAGISDYHNTLKTGYDINHLCWPDWVLALPHSVLLPKVLSPGSIIGNIQFDIAKTFNISPDCLIHAGTTDSTAAFIASGVSSPGIGVTSLGTTLVLKQLSTQRIDAPEFGIYSHRFGSYWLVGGASNAGGGVLQNYFNNQQLEQLSAQIDLKKIESGQISPLDYYPLSKPGERFPFNDATFPPRLTPRPSSDVAFLHGILQGLAQIENTGYKKLHELGATPIQQIISNGGGAKSLVWQTIRSQLIGVSITRANYDEAAYGAALLGLRTGCQAS